MAMKSNDPIGSLFRRKLVEMYGDRLGKVILFGSHARGNARTDSDYDVAVFLKSVPNRWQELDRLADASLDFVDETGVVVNAFAYPLAAYDERTPLMGEIRREGVEL
ncbi:MAG: nucleotidyltransferase domain-containing protein [Rhodomicrobium sp.]